MVLFPQFLLKSSENQFIMSEEHNIVSHTDALNSVRGTAQYAVDCIRERIFSGQYAPNSFLPSQRKLAGELGVGHWGVRMALEKLAQAGLVESIRSQGTRVLPAEERAVQAPVAFFHTPVKVWRDTMEPVHIRDGVLQRLQATGHPCIDIAHHCRDMRLQFRNCLDMRTGVLDDLTAMTKGCGGFIFLEASGPIAEVILDLERRRVPVVVANLEESGLPVSGTCLDHTGVSVRAVEMLISFGHRRIAYLGVSPSSYFYGKALEGYRQSMEAVSLPVDESLIVFCESSSSLLAYRACKSLITQADPPTAIVAARDVIASGACHAIEEAGLKVGRDISVIGFDDVSWGRPEEDFLTTFREPCTEMGSVAVDMLLDRIQNGWQPPKQRLLDAPLVLRRSVGPCIGG